MNFIHLRRKTAIRRLPPFHALRAFEAAARHLHFGRAAEELDLDPTAISHQVRKLEAWLDAPLFHRHPRPLHLSDKGALLYPAIRDALDNMEAAIMHTSGARPGPLVISMTMGFAAEWFTPRQAQLRADTGLDMIVEADNRPASLDGGDVDLAIRTQEQPDSDHVWHRLFGDRLIAVAAPALVERYAPAPEDVELRELPLIRYRWTVRERPAPAWHQWFDTIASEEELVIAGDFSEESHAIGAATAGLGAALLSERLVMDRLARGELVRLGSHYLPMPSFWAAYRKGHPRSRDLDRLAARLADKETRSD